MESDPTENAGPYAAALDVDALVIGAGFGGIF